MSERLNEVVYREGFYYGQEDNYGEYRQEFYYELGFEKIMDDLNEVL